VQSFGSTSTGAADVALPFFIERYAEAYSAEISHFLDCVTSGDTPLTSFVDGLEALRIADAAQESVRTGVPVRLDKRG